MNPSPNPNEFFQIRDKRTYIDKFRHTGYVPEEVGNFAISADGDFTGCDTTKYHAIKTNLSPPFDLNVGYDPDTFGTLECGTTFPPWEKGLKWVTGSNQGYSKLNGVQVVTHRGILKDIGYTIHNYYKNPWMFEACKFEGKVYIREQERDIVDLEFANDRHKKNCYWGIKFHDYIIDSDPKFESGYCYKMIKAKIGNTKVLFSADVDGVDTRSGDHVELKTCYAKRNTLKNSLSRAWMQSFLGDIQYLLYGIKDEDGIIRRVPTKIPMSSDKILLSDDDKDSMMGFLSEVLEWLCDSLDENAMWHMEYDGNSTISLKRSGEKFLPKWYVKCLVNPEAEGDDMLVRDMRDLDIHHPTS